MIECKDPTHVHDRHDDLWHLWTDEHGRRHAQPCPITAERLLAKKQEQDALLSRKEDWWSK